MSDARADVLILGGGVAGLWLLDELVRAGVDTLLIEAHRLGTGQTLASQGIIHGGLKYTLDGWLDPSAAAIREMPALWRECFAGRRAPHLDGAIVRAEFCHLWRTGAWASRLGMVGARSGLRVAPTRLARQDWPAALRESAGEVFRLDEQVIDPGALLRELAAKHPQRVLACDGKRGLAAQRESDGEWRFRLLTPCGGDFLDLTARTVVLTAGAGNEALRAQLGLPSGRMQRRPLHMVMVRGKLPMLFGHCTDASSTRVTITSAADLEGRTVWQVGGRLAEDGVATDEPALLRHAAAELRAVLGGLDLSDAEFSAYGVDRAEGRTASGRRPAGVVCEREENAITVWPTKLALAPQAAYEVLQRLAVARAAPNLSNAGVPAVWAGMRADLSGWPVPEVAEPPWEEARTWKRVD